jgi:hypothetical protein
MGGAGGVKKGVRLPGVNVLKRDKSIAFGPNFKAKAHRARDLLGIHPLGG